MITWEEKPHWSFALGVALIELDRLIGSLDIAENLESMSSTGIPDPDDLLAIIDGFLRERDSLYDGDVARLEQDRIAIQEIVAPAYQAGSKAARQLWADALPEEHARLAKYQYHEVLEEA